MTNNRKRRLPYLNRSCLFVFKTGPTTLFFGSGNPAISGTMLCGIPFFFPETRWFSVPSSQMVWPYRKLLTGGFAISMPSSLGKEL